jgi:hypothetical protein
MTPHRILQLNALFTTAGAVGMLITRGALYTLFGLETPLLLDAIAAGLLAYAGALLLAASRHPVDRKTLIAFTFADGAWVVGSAVILALFWAQLAPVARVLVIVVALAVDVFAFLQFRAAGAVRRESLRPA